MPLSSGFAAPEYQAVRALFDSFLGDDPEYSAQVAGYHAGTKVVDLSGGRHLAQDSITGAYSCSKGVAAFVVALLLQDGLLDLDRTVAHYWPEFAANGKGTITVRHTLSHRAGLLGVEGIRLPYGVGFFLGLPEDQEPRYREVLFDVDPLQPWLDPLGVDGLNGNAPVSTVMELPNHRVIRASGMSSAGGVGSAEGLARLYAAATTGLDGGDASYGIGFGYIPGRQEEGRTPGRAHRLAHAVRQAACSIGREKAA